MNTFVMYHSLFAQGENALSNRFVFICFLNEMRL